MKKSLVSAISISALLLLTMMCRSDKSDGNEEKDDFITEEGIIEEKETIIIDSDMTFDEAIEGTKAPQSVIDNLVLLDVEYKSTDGKIHRGQILVNKKIEKETLHMFEFMLENDFVIEKAIPIVKYNWSDSLSMDDNNSSSFCYRNITYSKHATGMAIDINPRFNPLRWKKVNRPNQPDGAVLDTTINGTLHPNHIVVKEFRKLEFRWGHSFSKYYDDHHFEKN